MKDFKFEEGRHIYTLDGKPLMGVTTVLGVVAKPALIQWSANMAVKYIKDNFDGELTAELLKEASVAHRKRKEDAGQKGTDIHAEVEVLVNEAIDKFDGFIPADTTHDAKQVQKFIKWAVENEVQFLSSEQRMYSEKYWLAGTADFTCIMGGKKYVGDLKTSGGIYYEYWMQVAGYRLMLEEMGEKGYHGALIVRVGKDNSFEVQERYDYDTDRDAFLGALQVYKAKKLNK